MYERAKVAAKKSKAKEFKTIQTQKNRFNNHSSPLDQILFLQRTIGNQAVESLLKSGIIQAKLKIGKPNDIYEQEADRVAEQIVSRSWSVVNNQMEEREIQRHTEEEERKREEEERTIQLKKMQGNIPEVTPDLESRIRALKGNGQPLPKSIRTFFESRFGYDFSHVRIHTDPEAAKLARALNAEAFTYGRDIYFGEGRYNPNTLTGKRLLAHELVHVVQQSSGITFQKKVVMSISDHLNEQKANGVSLQLKINSVLTTVPIITDTFILQRKVTSKYREIQKNLSYGLFDWIITDEEAREVLNILKNLSDRDLRDTCLRMWSDGLWDRFENNLPKDADSDFRNLIERLKGRKFSEIVFKFDGKYLIACGDGKELFKVKAYSGKPIQVREEDINKCKGKKGEYYLNNKRYVAIKNYGPIPEGEYEFSTRGIQKFSFWEQIKLLASSEERVKIKGQLISRGDWGAGRVRLKKIKINDNTPCENEKPSNRTGFYLHGGILKGSSGCIDVQDKFDDIAKFLALFLQDTSKVKLSVTYKHEPPKVSYFTSLVSEIFYNL